MKKILLLSCCTLLIAQSGFARENAGVVGASTLSSGTIAVTGNLGIDVLPEPLLYGVRFDAGLGDRFQVGFGGSYFDIIAGAALYLKGNVWHSADEKHFFSISLDPGFVRIEDFLFSDDDHFITYVKSALVYEMRLKEAKKIGWYTRLGGLKPISVTNANTSDFIADKDSFTMFLETGIQSRISEHFTWHLEIGQYLPVAPEVDLSRYGIHGKTGFSFLF